MLKRNEPNLKSTNILTNLKLTKDDPKSCFKSKIKFPFKETFASKLNV